MKKLLIGTNNPNKFKVFTSYLQGLNVEFVSPSDLGLSDIPAENARNATGNALEKARAWHRASGLPVITEDSGLVFFDLPPDHPDQPGVMVRRASGHVMDDEEMLAWYSAIIRRHGGQLRSAWEDAWCVLKDETTYALHADTPETLEHHMRLMVADPCAARIPGWPLDSLTYSPIINKYVAEMTPEEKRAAANANQAAAQADQLQLIEWLRSEVSKL